MGASEPQFPDARPWHRVYLDSFWIDKTEVTNEDFLRFVKAKGYVTVAEKAASRPKFPRVPKEKLVTGSAVFTPPSHPVSLSDPYGWWSYVKGASWKHPTGPASSIQTLQKHPVVQVAYDDASRLL